jgi:hypothetical protein
VDDYLLVARALSEGYLYVFQVDALGKKQWLFPKNENFQFSSGANPVKPSQSLQIPSAAKKAFFLDDNTGIEHIYVVFSANRWPELEAALSRPLPSAPVGTAVAVVEVPNGLQSRGVGGTHDNAAPAKMDSSPAPETVHGHTYQEWGAGGQRFEATIHCTAAERVRHPTAKGRMIELTPTMASTRFDDGGKMIALVAPHRAHDRDIVDHAADVWEPIGNRNAGLAVASKGAQARYHWPPHRR